MIGVHYDRHGNRTGNAVTDNINDDGKGNRNVHENVDCNFNGDGDIDDTNSNANRRGGAHVSYKCTRNRNSNYNDTVAVKGNGTVNASADEKVNGIGKRSANVNARVHS